MTKIIEQLAALSLTAHNAQLRENKDEALRLLESGLGAIVAELEDAQSEGGKAAVLAAQASGQAQDADMYWDADDPERFAATDLHGAVEYMMDGYTMSDLPMDLDLQCARSMPNVQVRVIGYTDTDEWQYEVVDAARAAGGEQRTSGGDHE